MLATFKNNIHGHCCPVMTKCLKPDLYWTENKWKNEQSIKNICFQTLKNMHIMTVILERGETEEVKDDHPVFRPRGTFYTAVQEWGTQA